MTGHRTLSGTDGRLRISPWRGDPSTAHLSAGAQRPTAAAVAQALDELAGSSYRAAQTAALAGAEQGPFLELGFEVHERLHLLVRPLGELPHPDLPPADLRRGRRADRSLLLAVDTAAFPPFWRLDGLGLADALAATPAARLRVAAHPAAPTLSGYAITGRAGPRGYVQRLAVDPAAQGTGIGTALVIDGLRWLRRWGAKQALVNTQEENAPAVRLYERLGFRLQAEGLAVLRRRVGGTSS